MSDLTSLSRRQMSGRRSSRAAGLAFPAVVAILLVAFCLGGGGQRYGLANLCVQLAALGALALCRHAVARFWIAAPLPLRVLVALTLLLPLLQLVPLPHSIWSSLPGREIIAPSFEAAGETGWHALSLDPRRSLLALSGLIAPIAILFVGWTVREDQLAPLGWLIAALGLLTLLIGAVQIVSAKPPSLWVHEALPSNVLLGTFANRNSTGLFLVGALAFSALAPLPRPHPAALPLRAVMCLLLILAIILTRSRTSLVLMAIPLGLAALRALAWAMAERRSARAGSLRANPFVLAAGMIALGAALIAALLALAPGRVAETIERFDALESDARIYVWEDAAFASARYWPLGAGMGTFDEVFQLDESLEFVTERRAGRAHNDYLELSIEAGLPGLALAAGWAALLAWFAWRARVSRLRWLAWAAAAFLLAIALQSLTDYPLRNQTMLAAAGLCLLILARIASRTERESR